MLPAVNVRGSILWLFFWSTFVLSRSSYQKNQRRCTRPLLIPEKPTYVKIRKWFIVTRSVAEIAGAYVLGISIQRVDTSLKTFNLQISETNLQELSFRIHTPCFSWQSRWKCRNIRFFRRWIWRFKAIRRQEVYSSWLFWLFSGWLNHGPFKSGNDLPIRVGFDSRDIFCFAAFALLSLRFWAKWVNIAETGQRIEAKFLDRHSSTQYRQMVCSPKIACYWYCSTLPSRRCSYTWRNVNRSMFRNCDMYMLQFAPCEARTDRPLVPNSQLILGEKTTYQKQVSAVQLTFHLQFQLHRQSLFLS